MITDQERVWYSALYEEMKATHSDESTADKEEALLRFKNIFNGVLSTIPSQSISADSLIKANNDQDAEQKGVGLGKPYIASSSNTLGLRQGMVLVRTQ